MAEVDSSVLLLPVIPGGPREWDAPEHLIEQALETVPDTHGWLLTEEAWNARQLIAARRWLLIRNEPLNEPTRSEVTGRKETYFQYQGVDRPWNGLDDVGAWLFDLIDPDNTDPTTAEVIAGIIGTWQGLGRIEYISDAKAKELSTHIFLKTRRQVNLYEMAQPAAREARRQRELAQAHERR